MPPLTAETAVVTLSFKSSISLFVFDFNYHFIC
jgi:hypothetical protein